MRSEGLALASEAWVDGDKDWMLPNGEGEVNEHLTLEGSPLTDLRTVGVGQGLWSGGRAFRLFKWRGFCVQMKGPGM